jgi:hypothetical protein
MKKKVIKLNKKYSLDMGSQCPVDIKTKEFVENGVKCEYLSSWQGRVEIVGYEIFEMNGYSKQ